MRNTDYSGQDLSGKILSGQDFAGSDFTGADLSGADISRCNFTGSNLTDADLTGAKWFNALWHEAIFRNTRFKDGVFANEVPLTVYGLLYPVMMIDGHMFFGCVDMPETEYAALTEETVLQLDNVEPRAGKLFWQDTLPLMEFMRKKRGLSQ